MNMLSLATIAVVILHPQIMENGIVRPGRGGSVGNPFIPNDQEVLAVLPTPLSAEVHEEPHALPLSFTASPVTQAKNGDMSTAKMFYGSIVYKDWFAERPVNEHHLNYGRLYTTLKFPCTWPFFFPHRGLEHLHRSHILHTGHHFADDLRSHSWQVPLPDALLLPTGFRLLCHQVWAE